MRRVGFPRYGGFTRAKELFQLLFYKRFFTSPSLMLIEDKRRDEGGLRLRPLVPSLWQDGDPA